MLAAAVRSLLPAPLAPRRSPSRRRAGYAFTDLGTCAEGSPLLPSALNDAGAMGGAAAGRTLEGAVRGFIVRGAQREPIGTAFGQPPVAALSASGLAAGAQGAALRELRAWASHRGVFGERWWPGAISGARGVNDAGTVVGNVLFDAGEFMLSRGFVLPADGPPRFLTPPMGGTSTAVGINNAGTVILNSSPLGAAPEATRAWCLQDGCYINLTNLGGRRVWAAAITARGRVVGHALRADGATHAFIWEEGESRDLGTWRDAQAEALAANDELTVVGRLTLRSGKRQAFRWTPARGLHLLAGVVDLPFGWTLHEAIAVNARGEVAGIGSRRGQRRGFLLRPLE